jgi:hypothetical protein
VRVAVVVDHVGDGSRVERRPAPGGTPKATSCTTRPISAAPWGRRA